MFAYFDCIFTRCQVGPTLTEKPSHASETELSEIKANSGVHMKQTYEVHKLWWTV